MHISYAEMLRASHEVLRMLGGYPFGMAAEAVEGLMMTHAALGKAYALTRLADAAGLPARPLDLSGGKAETLRVDLGGAPLVLLAGRLADAFVAEEAAGMRHLAVSETNGGWMAPYLAFCIARHGLPCHGSWRPTTPRHTDEAPALLIAARPGPDGSLPRVTIAEFDGRDAPDGLFITCTNEPPEIESSSRPQLIDFDASIRHALQEGFEADEQEHRAHFTGVAARIRVAFSERSRTQAG